MRYRHLILVLWMPILVACGPVGQRPVNKTTDTRSSMFATDAEKIAFLQQYLTLASPIQAAEFHIVYHDNSAGGVPGPSDWDMQVVLVVAPADLPRWTQGMQPVVSQHVDLTWADPLLPPEQHWRITSAPTVYQRAGTLVAVFAPEGIVFKRVSTMMP